jgi:hypothetical protein
LNGLAESVTLAHNLGIISAMSKSTMFFWAALEMVAPDIKQAEKDLQAQYGAVEGFDRWADKYGIPMRAVEVEAGGKIFVRIERTDLDFPKSSPHTFVFRERIEQESVKEYIDQLDEALEDWRESVIKRERSIFAAPFKLVVDWEQMYYAEWFVLHRLKGMSHREIAELYTTQKSGDSENFGSYRRHYDGLLPDEVD